MKRILLALTLLGSNLVAMTGENAAPATDSPVVARLKALDKNGAEQVVEFTHRQAMRLHFFSHFLLMANTGHDTQIALSKGMIGGFQDGVSFPWTTSETLELARQATVEVIVEPNAHKFVSTLRGDQACLLYRELHRMGFDQKLLAVIESDIAHRLLEDGQFFAQSLTPVTLEDRGNLPACAFSVFLYTSKLMREDLLPACVLQKNLLTQRKTSYKRAPWRELQINAADGSLGRYIMAHDYSSSDYRYFLKQNNNQIRVGQAQNMQWIGQPVYGTGAMFSRDNTLVLVWNTDNGRRTTTLYKTENMQPINIDPMENLKNAGLSPDGRFLMAERNDGITLYQTETKRPINTEPVTGCSSGFASFSPDSRFLLVTRHDGVTLYRTENMQPVNTHPLSSYMTAYASFSPDARFLLIQIGNEAILQTVDDMHTVYHESEVGIKQFSPGGRFLMLTKRCGSVVIYDTHTMQPVNITPTNLEYKFAKISPDNRILVARGCGDAYIYTFPSMILLGTFNKISENDIAFTDRSELTLPLYDDCHDLSRAYVVSWDSAQNSAHQMAVLATMHHKHAADEVKKELYAQKEQWLGMIANAPEKIKRFVRAQFAAPCLSCSVQ